LAATSDAMEADVSEAVSLAAAFFRTHGRPGEAASSAAAEKRAAAAVAASQQAKPSGDQLLELLACHHGLYLPFALASRVRGTALVQLGLSAASASLPPSTASSSWPASSTNDAAHPVVLAGVSGAASIKSAVEHILGVTQVHNTLCALNFRTSMFVSYTDRLVSCISSARRLARPSGSLVTRARRVHS
jgi:hypothetical protein